MALTVSVKAQATQYAGGDGTKDNPFLISNASELAKLANDVNTVANSSRGKYYKLTQDIVINEGVLQKGLTELQGGKAFPLTEMIGKYAGENDYTAFQGVFDGDGHVISGFYSVPGGNYAGLFRIIEGATIKNLGMKDCFVYAGAYLSIIAAISKNSNIINCYVIDSQISGWGSNSGPIVAQAFGTTKIQNCYTSMKLQTKNDTGGIVGRIGNGGTEQVVVENCYVTSTIILNKSNKGGVTATNAEGSTVRNCYFTSASGADAVYAKQDKGTTVDCRQMTVEEMQADDFLALLNSNSEAIPGACRWQKGETTPVHNYNVKTAEEAGKEISAMATDPVPADGDTHADMDAAVPQLSWTAAADGKTVKQYLFFGTDSATVAQATTAAAVATLGTETSYALTSNLSPLTCYYWRIDRVDADGQVTEGDVWSFQPRHLAFPGAEGYGRFARGGRGGKVVWVTNLNDSGEGSLRWALTNKQGPRTIMFKVSGIIDMNFKQCITDDNITIAAQSAPGKGICIKHSDIGVKSDCIVRFLRARRGLGTREDTGNAIGTTYSNNTILDHVTASWGTDETFSSRGSQNITFQSSMISEALGIAGHRNYDEGTNHGYAATIGGDIGSFHHNLLADCEGRNWSMGGGTDANGEYAGRLDIFNNVVYNWHKRTTDGGAHEVNFVGNYYKCGPANALNVLFSLDIEGNLKGTQSAFISGNIRDNYDGSLSEDRQGDTYRMNIRDGRPSVDWEYFVNQPFFPSYAKMETAQEAYKRVLSDVGANQPVVDNTDARIVNETLTRTYNYIGSKSGIKGEIDNEMDAGGFEDYPQTSWPDDYDTDMDGLPDWWELMRGLNVNSPAQDFSDSNADSDGDGYTELEHYLDFLAQPHVILAPGQSYTIDMKTLFAGYTNNPQFSAEETETGILNSQFSILNSHVNGSLLTVQGGNSASLSSINMSVRDADNATYSRRLCVAVTEHATTAIKEVKEDSSLFNSPSKTRGGKGALNSKDAVYDLTGRKVAEGSVDSSLFNSPSKTRGGQGALNSSLKLQPGIYIKNGRKLVSKW